MDSVGMSVIKYILFFFNLLFLISGIGIISAGAIVVNEVSQFSHFLEDRIITPPIILIVVGAVVFLIAFLGCYGAIKENFIMLIAFAIALVIIFLVEMAVGIVAATFVTDFKENLKTTLSESIQRDSNDDKYAWNHIQSVLRCCGVESKYDWDAIMSDGLLPESCCAIANDQSRCSVDSPHVHQHGCYNLLEMKATENAKLLVGVGIGIAFVEIAGIILACFLATAIRRGNNQ